MGSPLSPVIANLFMEQFEERAIETSKHKPTTWFRYVDDTFVVWSAGMDKLNDFLRHLNSQHPSIQFTMETEKDQQLPFLDVLVRKRGNKLGHTVYRKPTHTDRYLHALSNHHQSQKYGVIRTLTERARRICEPENLQSELEHLRTAFEANGYSRRDIERSMCVRTPARKEIEERSTISQAYLPYIPRVTDRIGRILRRHDVRTIFKPTQKIHQIIGSVKDKRDPLSAAGVYRIPCSCGKVYIGTTKRSMGTRLKEHKASCRLGQTEKSAVAEHALSEGDHEINFEGCTLLASVNGFQNRLVREAIEIRKHSNNFNRKEETLSLNPIWNHIIRNTRVMPLDIKTPTGAERAPLPTATEVEQTTPPMPRYKYNLRTRIRQSTSRIRNGTTSEEARHSC
ncbi:hypothetical protein WA026_008924 [Henosepilachna vigintioctopunctata]|uniref:Reverse transcriptase domain-containing protein n=1 Tax=Henosepilachna vigintioctopunctata TaxID=420089 RepID=A0AAW1VDP5_9CUCU